MLICTVRLEGAEENIINVDCDAVVVLSIRNVEDGACTVKPFHSAVEGEGARPMNGPELYRAWVAFAHVVRNRSDVGFGVQKIATIVTSSFDEAVAMAAGRPGRLDS